MLDVSRSDLVAGVAGAGTMGRGIAQVLAQCGARTLLFDAQPGAAQKAKERSPNRSPGWQKGRLGTPEVQAIWRASKSRPPRALPPATWWSKPSLNSARKKLFSRLESIVKQTASWPTTPLRPVTAMAAACKRLQRVVLPLLQPGAGDENRRGRGQLLTGLVGERFGPGEAFRALPVRARTRPGSSSIMPGARTSPNRCACCRKASPTSPPSTGSWSKRRDFASGPSA
jgi:hypothetical protein